MILIEIEIKDQNHFKAALHKLHSRLEDMMFSIIMKIPEKYVSDVFMNWIDRYTTKRINELKHQQIRSTWKNIYLQKAVDDIAKR